MSSDAWILLSGWVLTSGVMLSALFRVGENYSKERDKMFDERNSWQVERQQLLDRIQAPTFAEYKHQEVKVIKAKNGTDKPDVVIEQL